MRLYEITQLLTESRLDYLIKNYSSQVARQLSQENSISHSPYHPDKRVINWITDLIDLDPSHNGMYTQWMLIQYIKGNFVYEDSGNVLDDLTYFHVNKRAFEQKDINQYTVDELYNAVKQIEDQEDSALTNRQIKAQVKQGAEKVLETENVLVITPKTKAAAQYYGKGTRWCTSAIKNNAFDYYNERGPLYIIIDKKTNEKFQIHFESYSIMDDHDHEVDVLNFTEQYPEVYNYFKQKFRQGWPQIFMTESEIEEIALKDSKFVLDTEHTRIISITSLITLWYYSDGTTWLINEDSSSINFGNSIFLNSINDISSHFYVCIDKQQAMYNVKFVVIEKTDVPSAEIVATGRPYLTTWNKNLRFIYLNELYINQPEIYGYFKKRIHNFIAQGKYRD